MKLELHRSTMQTKISKIVVKTFWDDGMDGWMEWSIDCQKWNVVKSQKLNLDGTNKKNEDKHFKKNCIDLKISEIAYEVSIIEIGWN